MHGSHAFPLNTQLKTRKAPNKFPNSQIEGWDWKLDCWERADVAKLFDPQTPSGPVWIKVSNGWAQEFPLTTAAVGGRVVVVVVDR